MIEKFLNKEIPKPLEINAAKIDLNRRIEGRIQGPNEGQFYSTRERRISHLSPSSSDLGSWSGEIGESVYKLNEHRGAIEAMANSFLKSKGLDGISYKDGVPDFSKVAEATVQIPYMTSWRPTNFEQADRALAAKWNIEAKNGKDDWTARNVKSYRQGNHLSWHERSDCKTMDLITSCVHGSFKHSGGVMECSIRDANNANVKYSGVKFDD